MPCFCSPFSLLPVFLFLLPSILLTFFFFSYLFTLRKVVLFVLLPFSEDLASFHLLFHSDSHLSGRTAAAGAYPATKELNLEIPFQG